MLELMNEINTLGQEINPNKLLLASKMENLAARLRLNEEIPDEVFTLMHQDMRNLALTGLVLVIMNGLSE